MGRSIEASAIKESVVRFSLLVFIILLEEGKNEEYRTITNLSTNLLFRKQKQNLFIYARDDHLSNQQETDHRVFPE